MNENIEIIAGGICAVSDVKANGVRSGKYGLTIISFPKSNVAGVFTTNKIVAAPVIHTKEIIKNNKISAIVANSGNANCFTGNNGLNDCQEMIKSTSFGLNITEDEIAIASTGVIGRKMPMDIINELIKENIPKLENSNEASINSAKAIMTTDTFYKEFAVEIKLNNGEKVKIGAICKGVGMIAPNMATLLCFIATDAKIEDEQALKNSLKIAVNKSLNMLVVDGDESTNDEVLLIATGKVNVLNDNVIDSNFQEGLNFLAVSLAKMMATDGEGATKFLEVTVTGASTEEDAKLVSKSVISSSLVKTAVFGEDPNWGRIVCAMGYSGADFNPDNVSISISAGETGVYLVKNSEILGFQGTENLLKAEEIMKNDEIKIYIDLHLGNEKATAFGCDLSYDYVKINAEYTS
ncbi:MAG: bifunctional ornithine acetyltransferase/N-acetylglutamate synthase [Methanobrevibacter sp.]|jgi:glutamate N-acetyltransferase/amino-acid N-acetyltransferase|nr:bifunctional ornithine acetyltransferase/N-acetylglutamate synthase [Methanobrevibacter sp.]